MISDTKGICSDDSAPLTQYLFEDSNKHNRMLTTAFE